MGTSRECISPNVAGCIGYKRACVNIISLCRFSNVTRARDNESLKAKFKTLRLHKKPTGDPDCPPDVRRAKRLYRLIEQNADTVGVDESESKCFSKKLYVIQKQTDCIF